MTFSPRRLIRPALLLGCLGLLLPATAIATVDKMPAFEISDKAKMFSAAAVEKAQEKIDAIKRDYDKDVLVETFAELPADAKKELQGAGTEKEKSKFWREFAARR